MQPSLIQTMDLTVQVAHIYNRRQGRPRRSRGPKAHHLRSPLVSAGNVTTQGHQLTSSFRLGLFSADPIDRKGSLLDTLANAMCKKMLYQPGERDMLMLQHTFGIELADGSKVL